MASSSSAPSSSSQGKRPIYYDHVPSSENSCVWPLRYNNNERLDYDQPVALPEYPSVHRWECYPQYITDLILEKNVPPPPENRPRTRYTSGRDPNAPTLTALPCPPEQAIVALAATTHLERKRVAELEKENKELMKTSSETAKELEQLKTRFDNFVTYYNGLVDRFNGLVERTDSGNQRLENLESHVFAPNAVPEQVAPEPRVAPEPEEAPEEEEDPEEEPEEALEEEEEPEEEPEEAPEEEEPEEEPEE